MAEPKFTSDARLPRPACRTGWNQEVDLGVLALGVRAGDCAEAGIYAQERVPFDVGLSDYRSILAATGSFPQFVWCATGFCGKHVISVISAKKLLRGGRSGRIPPPPAGQMVFFAGPAMGLRQVCRLFSGCFLAFCGLPKKLHERRLTGKRRGAYTPRLTQTRRARRPVRMRRIAGPKSVCLRDV